MKFNARALRISLTLVAVAGLTAAMGNACSQLQSASPTAANGSTGLGSGTCTEAPVAAFQALPGQQTLGIVYGSNVVQNMEACTGLGKDGISQTTSDDIMAREPSFAQTSYIGNINSAMMMAIAQVAFDMCADLATREANLPAANRTVFNQIDFTKDVANAAIDDSLNRIARNCWGRLPTTAETAAVEQSLMSLNTTSASTKAIGVCSAVLASLSGIVQ